MKKKLMMWIVMWGNCHIGTYQTADSTTSTVAVNVINLADSVGHLPYSAGHRDARFGIHEALGKDSGHNSLLRAHCSAAAAAGTTVASPLNDIGKFLQRQLSVLV